jgi:hypothetical protein
MNKASIQATPRPQAKSTPLQVNGVPDVRVRPGDRGPIMRVLHTLASLRITVVLFSLSFVLVFCGTLAQTQSGIWTAVADYFRSFYVWIPFQLFVKFAQVFFGLDEKMRIGGSFPFPGGLTLGIALLVNLLAAHAVRFRLTWKRSGILLTHIGVLLLLVGEGITGQYAVEARMTLAEGETVNFVDVSNGHDELAFIDRSEKDKETVIVVPDWKLKKGGTISDDLLPVDIRVLEYMKNSELQPIREISDKYKDIFTTEDGMHYALVPRAEGAGVKSEREDAAAVRVEFLKKGTGESLGKHMLALWFYPNYFRRLFPIAPQKLTVDDKTYDLEFRPKRVYKDYSITLNKFTHEVYMGTDKPKDFRSTVQLVDASRGVDRQVDIYMNSPLRHAGETFYQSSFLDEDKGTVLQVVYNPAWTLPYLSCIIVGLGLIVHFGLHLYGFMQRRMAL